MACLCLLVALAGWSVTATSAAPLPSLPTDTSPPYAVRPAIILFTGDGTGWLVGPGARPVPVNGQWTRAGHIQWSIWSAEEGIGAAEIWARTCGSLKCASNPWTGYPATVRVFDPVGDHFTRMDIYSRQGGKQVIDDFLVAGRLGWGYAGRG